MVKLGGEENILLAAPPSWRRVHHATLEPGRACKKRLQVLLQNITVLSIQGVFFLFGAPLKVLSVRLNSKSHQRSLKVSEFTYRKKLVIFRGAPVQKDTL